MAIAGYAVGADQGFVYVRGEYPVAAKRLERAIRAAERRGLLGSRVLDSGFNFRIDVRIGAGAFVCGEETALMASIMGIAASRCRARPTRAERAVGQADADQQRGDLWQHRAHHRERRGVVCLDRHGQEQGHEDFRPGGQGGNHRADRGADGHHLREIVYDIGGGIPDGLAFKAAQTGGPSGGCIPAAHLDTPVDYESLKALGSIMGSGGLIIMDERSCMVDVAKFFMEFCMDESCGKCVPCRVGTVQMHRLLERITDGSATLQDLEALQELCMMVKETSLCGLGQSAPNPVLSTIRYFGRIHRAHRDHHCPAGVCTLEKQPVGEWVQA
jgi:bidirectional [NiFe] hydrogenase diaphorase subunit